MNGWARRLDTGSIVWHYFRHTVSEGVDHWTAICGKHWTDPVLPVKATVYEGMVCPRCVALRTPAATDKQLGISMRFIRQYDIKADTISRPMTFVEEALLSCQRLGHTFEHNPNEDRCTICGALKVLPVEPA